MWWCNTGGLRVPQLLLDQACLAHWRLCEYGFFASRCVVQPHLAQCKRDQGLNTDGSGPARVACDGMRGAVAAPSVIGGRRCAQAPIGETGARLSGGGRSWRGQRSVRRWIWSPRASSAPHRRLAIAYLRVAHMLPAHALACAGRGTPSVPLGGEAYAALFRRTAEITGFTGRQGRSRSSGSPGSGPGSAAVGAGTRAGCAAGPGSGRTWPGRRP